MTPVKNDSKKFLGYMKDIACKGCINFENNKCFINHKITIETKVFYCKSYVDKSIIYSI